MSLQVRPLDPDRDDSPQSGTSSPLASVLESAFGRSGHELEFVRSLREHPRYDSEFAFGATIDGELVGATVFLPSQLHLFGTPIAAASCAPLGVAPQAQGRGVGRALLSAGHDALSECGIRCITAIGNPDFFHKSGYASAFHLNEVRIPIEVLEPNESQWRGIAGDDLQALAQLHERTWLALDGSEKRGVSAQEWEARARNSYALCHENSTGIKAYVRFRVRNDLEITDCCIADHTAIAAVFSLFAQLGREHGRDVVTLRCPDEHPVARAAFHRGAQLETSDFGGAALLKVLDWPALLTDLADALTPRLLRAPRPSISLGIDGEDVRISFEGGELRATNGRIDERHIELPAATGPGLLTGKYSGEELAYRCSEASAEARETLAHLFPRRSPAWMYGPLFELADE